MSIKHISNYLKSLNWQPNGGPKKIKGIWDGRNFDLRYFSKYPYVVICGTLDQDRNETYDYLLALETKESAQYYYKWNQVGSGCFRILNTNTGSCVAEWYATKILP